jgi:eukaryotic-like serine/threonine-protein kinase
VNHIKIAPGLTSSAMLASVVAPVLQSGSVISGRFRLERELGRGGMGTVWEARHLALETQVAIKFLKSELSQRQDIRLRFAREATSAARIRSPNVVGVLDSGFTEEDGYGFIVMELLLGEDLGKKLSRVGTCSLEETRTLVVQAARGLAKAHAVGILHRDLKPENLFVSSDDEATIKILDFGIAKAFGPEAATHKTDTGQLLGTPMYMSPEQALGRALDSRSDLYSLAVVAYRCLAGRTPFDHAAPGELIVAVSMQAPPPPSRFNPALPRVLDAWFASALAKDPDARSCQSASELADSFEQACAEGLASRLQPPLVAPTLARPSSSALANEARSVSPVELATTVMVPVLQTVRRSRLWMTIAVALAFVTLGLGSLLLQPSPAPPAPRSKLSSGLTPPTATAAVAALAPPSVGLATASAEVPSAPGAVVALASSARSKVQLQSAGAPKRTALSTLERPTEPAEGARARADMAVATPPATLAPSSSAAANSAAGAGGTPHRAETPTTEPPELGIDRTSPW